MSRGSMTCGGSRRVSRVGAWLSAPFPRQAPSPLRAGPGASLPLASALLRASLSRVTSLDPPPYPTLAPGKGSQAAGEPEAPSLHSAGRPRMLSAANARIRCCLTPLHVFVCAC